MRDRLWTKDFTIDVCINFLLYVIMYQLMLWSTQFAIHTWDATVSEAGLASGIFIIGALSSRIVTGHVIDALGRKKASSSARAFTCWDFYCISPSIR